MPSSNTSLVATPSTSRFPTDDFHRLVADLGTVLGPSSGIDDGPFDVIGCDLTGLSETLTIADPQDLINLMDSYTSKQSEWSQYAFSDASRGYTRNLVSRGNGKSNL